MTNTTQITTLSRLIASYGVDNVMKETTNKPGNTMMHMSDYL